MVFNSYSQKRIYGTVYLRILLTLHVHEYGGNGEIWCSEIKNLLQLITQR